MSDKLTINDRVIEALALFARKRERGVEDLRTKGPKTVVIDYKELCRRDLIQVVGDMWNLGYLRSKSVQGPQHYLYWMTPKGHKLYEQIKRYAKEAVKQPNL